MRSVVNSGYRLHPAPARCRWRHGIVITNARIVTGLSEDAKGIIPQGSVFVKDGKIVSVSAGAATVPDGAQVIDAQA